MAWSDTSLRWAHPVLMMNSPMMIHDDESPIFPPVSDEEVPVIDCLSSEFAPTEVDDESCATELDVDSTQRDGDVDDVCSAAATCGNSCDDTFVDTLQVDTEVADTLAIEDAKPTLLGTAESPKPDIDKEEDVGTQCCGWFSSQRSFAISQDTGSSGFDSQLTINDDPMSSVDDVVGTKSHFTKDNIFYKSIMDQLENYLGEDWIELSPAFHLLCPDWETNVHLCTTVVHSVANRADEFKIGITADPHWRWKVCPGGAYLRQGFRKMTILYAAPFSKPYTEESSGCMERALIAVFRCLPQCLNVKPGGEGASAFSPHYVYVVER
jgi:hypothetical protein